MKYIFTTCFLILGFLSVTAQKKNTWLGFEGALTRNYSMATDFGTNVKAKGIDAEIWGFHIRQDIKTDVFIETGFLRNNSTPGYYYKSIGDVGSYGIGHVIRTVQIPLRLGTRINIYKKKFYLVPVVGYAFGVVIHPEKLNVGIAGKTWSLNDTINYIGSVKTLGHYYSLVQTGLGLECKVYKSILLSLAVNYYAGFQPVAQTEIYYHSNRQAYSTARVLSNGSYLSYGLALKFPISELWNKKIDN